MFYLNLAWPQSVGDDKEKTSDAGEEKKEREADEDDRGDASSLGLTDFFEGMRLFAATQSSSSGQCPPF